MLASRKVSESWKRCRIAGFLCLLVAASVFLSPFPGHCVSDTKKLSRFPTLPRHHITFNSGNVFLEYRDLPWFGQGKGLQWIRSYNSQEPVLSILGYGWTFTGNDCLTFEGTLPTYNRADGRIYKFTATGTNQWTSTVGAKVFLAKAGEVYTLTMPDKSQLLFDAQGRLTRTNDRYGQGLSLNYGSGRLDSITDDLGRSVVFAYNQKNLVASITTPVGVFGYTYDEDQQNLIRATNPDGTYRQYGYDDPKNPHAITRIIDETGELEQSLSYSDQGRVIQSTLATGDTAVIEYLKNYQRKITDSDGETLYSLYVAQKQSLVGSCTGTACNGTFTYDTRLQLTRVTDGRGNMTSYAYDTNGNVTSQTEAANSVSASRAITRSYNADNQIISRSEPSEGNTSLKKIITNTFDSQGNLISQTIKGYAGSVTITAVIQKTYNNFGQLTSRTDPLGHTTTLAYYPNTPDQGNNRNQLHTATNPLGQTWTFAEYTALGQPGTITGPDGQTVLQTYDFSGRVLSQTSAGVTTSLTRDAAGRITEIAQGPAKLNITYSNGQVATITDALGSSIHYTRDAKGRVVNQEIQDPQGALHWSLGLAYDALGNLTAKKYPDNAEELFEDDAAGNLISAKTPMGMETTISYDERNRPLITTEAGETVSSRTYTAHQTYLSSLTDGRSNNTKFTWDDFGKVRTIQSPDTGLTTLSYDLNGNLIQKVDANKKTVSYAYDVLDRPIKQSYPGSRDLLYTWDTAYPGRLSEIQEEGSTRSFTYNSRGQVASETQNIGSVTTTTSYTYDDAGRLATLTYPSGAVVAYTRNAMGQITGISLDNTPLASSIQYLPFGPVQNLTLGNTTNQTRTYDQRYQPNRIQAGTYDVRYTRNLSGLLTTSDGLIDPQLSSETTTTSIQTTSNRITGVGGKTWTHDANGNVLSDGINSYTWDALNRLIQVKQNGTVLATYLYDTQNRRISKTSSGTTTYYVYDLDSRLIAETAADGTPIRDYVYLNNEPLAVREYQKSPGLYFFLNDHLATPQKLINTAGAVVWSAAYLPYGEAQVQVNSTITNNLRFPGQYYDEETDLHFNWNRYYDPVLGRYLSPDPIGLEGGLNLYGYVGGDPVNGVDPEGLCAWDACVGEGAYIVITVGTASAGWLASPQGQEALKWVVKNWFANENKEEEQCSVENSKRGNPVIGPPGGWVEHSHGKQDRLYGQDGIPKLDIDYGHDHGQGVPHVHNWVNGVRGPGVPASVIK